MIKTEWNFFSVNRGIHAWISGYASWGDVMYYNYHAQAKRLIQEGHLTHFAIVERWNHIAPALVLYFDNHIPMPIREERWSEYFCLL